MIEQVNSIIRNKLCQNESIYLPRIGSLIFSHTPAKKLSAKRIAAPHNNITFSGEERGSSLVDIIAEIAAIPVERADSIYEQWRQHTAKEGIVTIDGVGTISNRLFTPDAELARQLNLSPKIEFVRVRPRTNYLFYAIATLSICFAVGSAYYIVESEHDFAKRMDKQSVTQRDISGSTSTSEVTSQPKRITATVCTEPKEEEVVESPTTVSYEQPVAADDYLTPIDMSDNSSYAVWGVYGEVANAIRYAKMLHQNHSDLSVRIYNYKGRYMVAVVTGTSRSEVAKEIARLKSSDKQFGELWVYTNKL